MRAIIAIMLLACGPAWGLEPIDAKFALGAFETGAITPARTREDWLRGRAGERSRYQILPTVWRQYSQSTEFTDPDRAWRVASTILVDRRREFQRAAGRDWDPFWLYAMWNAPTACYRARFDRQRLSKVIADRAQRFSNLFTVYASR